MLRRSLLAAAILLASVSAAAQEPNATLHGKVTGQNGQARNGVAVDVLGPIRVFTETSESGQFTVHLTAGTYVIRIRDGTRRMEFPTQEVPAGDSNSSFQLNW